MGSSRVNMDFRTLLCVDSHRWQNTEKRELIRSDGQFSGHDSGAIVMSELRCRGRSWLRSLKLLSLRNPSTRVIEASLRLVVRENSRAGRMAAPLPSVACVRQAAGSPGIRAARRETRPARPVLTTTCGSSLSPVPRSKRGSWGAAENCCPACTTMALIGGWRIASS
jgi:hypothetical protein